MSFIIGKTAFYLNENEIIEGIIESANTETAIISTDGLPSEILLGLLTIQVPHEEIPTAWQIRLSPDHPDPLPESISVCYLTSDNPKLTTLFNRDTLDTLQYVLNPPKDTGIVYLDQNEILNEECTDLKPFEKYYTLGDLRISDIEPLQHS